MNEFIFLSLENIDDILIFSQVCKKGNEIYKKWKNEWYTIHTKIIIDVNEDGDKRETKIIGNREYVIAFYSNNNKKYKVEYKNGKRKYVIVWYKNGTIHDEGKYDENGIVWKWHHPI